MSSVTTRLFAGEVLGMTLLADVAARTEVAVLWIFRLDQVAVYQFVSN